jgi:hypothetical protein
MNLQLKKFNMNWISDDQVVVFVGKRKSGKSYCIRDMLYHKKTLPVGCVISPTEEANCFFGAMVPPLFIHSEYTAELLEKFMQRQKMVSKKLANGESDIDSRAFLILDDCLYDNKWTKDKNIRACFMNGRHYKILFILTMQYCLGINPQLRGNIDWVFLFRENILANRKRLFDNFAGMFPSFQIFCDVMDQCTENYECLVIHNSAQSNDIIDQVYWYKAEDHGSFRVGDDHFWQHNNNFHDDSGQNGNDDFDPQKYRPNRKGPPLHVTKKF